MTDKYIKLKDAIAEIEKEFPDPYQEWLEIAVDNLIDRIVDLSTEDLIPIDEIYDAGYRGEEVRFRIGGRLFAVRELAQ